MALNCLPRKFSSFGRFSSSQIFPRVHQAHPPQERFWRRGCRLLERGHESLCQGPRVASRHTPFGTLATGGAIAVGWLQSLGEGFFFRVGEGSRWSCFFFVFVSFFLVRWDVSETYMQTKNWRWLVRWVNIFDHGSLNIYVVQELVHVFFWMVVSTIFYFHAYLGKIPILTSIFFQWVGSTAA